MLVSLRMAKTHSTNTCGNRNIKNKRSMV